MVESPEAPRNAKKTRSNPVPKKPSPKRIAFVSFMRKEGRPLRGNKRGIWPFPEGRRDYYVSEI